LAKREGSPWGVLSGPGGALAQLCGLFLLGGGVGCLYAGFAAADGAFALRDFLTDYLALTGADRLSLSLWPLLWGEFRWLLAVVLLGFTALGGVGVPALFFVRGFLFSFSVGCFCRVFGWAGLLPALALFGIPALMWAPAFFLAGIQSLCGARCLKGRGKGDSSGRPELVSTFWIRFLLCFLLVMASVGAEYLLVPALLRAAARIIL